MNIKYAGLCFFLIMFMVLSGWFWHRQKLKLAPDVIITTITGQIISLKNLRGKTVLINFWATHCQSCVEEIPDLMELYYKYHAQGLEIISIAMFYDLPNHVVAMTQNKQIPYKVALDLRAKLAKAFGNVQLIPTTLLINPQGQIIFKKTGRFDKVAMEKRIQN